MFVIASMRLKLLQVVCELMHVAHSVKLRYGGLIVSEVSGQTSGPVMITTVTTPTPDDFGR